MKSEFKSGDTVVFNDKLFLIKQGLASTIQPKKWEKVQFEYLAYRVRNNEINTKKVYILKESKIRKAVLPPDSTKEIAKSVNLFEHKRNQEEFQKGDIVWHEGRLYCIDNINLKIKKLVPDSMFCETFVDTNYMAYPVHYDSYTSSYVIKKEGRTSICGSESDWIGASGDFFNCVRDLPLRSESGKEANVKLSMNECSHTKDSSKKQSTLKEQESVEFTKGQFVRVKDQEGVYRILRVESSSCWLDKLIIKGNSISVDIIPVRKDCKKLERLSAYEESLLRRESKPRVMGTIAQELKLEEMTNRFVESMSTRKAAQEDITKVKISDETLSSHLETCISEVEIEAIESFRREYFAANATLLEKAFIKIREFIRGLFESIKGISRQDQKSEVATLSSDYSNIEILQAIYVYVDGFLVCPTETRNKLTEFVGEYKRISSESERNHVVNKLSGTIKTIHRELGRGTDDIEKVNAIIADMIEYVQIVNESSKHSTDTKLELEHDYVKKLIRDSKAVGKVTSVDEIIKSDGYEVSTIECDKE